MAVRCVAVLAALLGSAGTAHADAQKVGFANAATDASGAETLIGSLRAQLASAGESVLANGGLRAALEKPLEPSTARTLDDAERALAAAKDAYAAFEYRAALDRLDEVDEITRAMPTSTRVLELVADRHLLAGQVHAGERADAKAKRSFRLVQRLSPGRRALDAAVYHPSLVALYRAARADDAGRTSELRITTTPAGAEVWVDDRSLGAAPVVARDISRGPHRIAAAAPGHVATARIVDIADRSSSLSLSLEAITPPDELGELRRELSASGTPEVALRRLALRIAQLADLDVVIIVRDAPRGSFEAATYRVSTDQLGEWISVPSSRFDSTWQVQDRAAASSGRVAPAAAIDADRDRADQRAWYRTWWGAGALAGGAVLVVGAVVWAVASSGGDSVDIADWCFGAECQ